MKRFCIYSSEVYFRQRKTEMETSSEKAVNFAKIVRIIIFDLRRGRSERKRPAGRCVCRERSRLKDLLQTSIQRHLVMDYAAQCSDPGYASVKPLLEGRVQPLAVDFLMEVACYLKMQLPQGATSKALLYFRLPRSHHMPKDWNEAGRCHTLLERWLKRSRIASSPFRHRNGT